MTITLSLDTGRHINVGILSRPPKRQPTTRAGRIARLPEDRVGSDTSGAESIALREFLEMDMSTTCWTDVVCSRRQARNVAGVVDWDRWGHMPQSAHDKRGDPSGTEGTIRNEREPTLPGYDRLIADRQIASDKVANGLPSGVSNALSHLDIGNLPPRLGVTLYDEQWRHQRHAVPHGELVIVGRNKAWSDAGKIHCPPSTLGEGDGGSANRNVGSHTQALSMLGAALCGARSWLTVDLLLSWIIDKRPPEKLATLIGVSPKTVRAHLDDAKIRMIECKRAIRAGHAALQSFITADTANAGDDGRAARYALIATGPRLLWWGDRQHVSSALAALTMPRPLLDKIDRERAEGTANTRRLWAAKQMAEAVAFRQQYERVWREPYGPTPWRRRWSRDERKASLRRIAAARPERKAAELALVAAWWAQNRDHGIPHADVNVKNYQRQAESRASAPVYAPIAQAIG